MRRLYLVLAAVWVVLGLARGFYLPGIAAVDYAEGAALEIFADRLSSHVDRVPYDYFALKFCEPKEGRRRDNLNLGEVLMGERDELTAYNINMLVPLACEQVCSVDMTPKEMKKLKEFISREYRVRMNVDNMPMVMESHDDVRTFFTNGIPIGFVDENGKVAINNHIRFTIHYHAPKFGPTDLNFKTDVPLFRIVGFYAQPMSIPHKNDKVNCARPDSQPNLLLKDGAQTITYTFDVDFERSDIKWATRWDQFLNADPELKNVLWVSIIDACAIVIILAAVVATVLLRTVYLDFSRYNNLEEADDAVNDSGWKLLHGDVFRPPQMFAMFCIFMGTGAQLFMVTIVILAFALLGFFSPSYRGGLLSVMILLMAASSIICGFVANTLHFWFGGTQRRAVTTGSAVFFPAVTFGVFFVLNLCLAIVRSSAAASFGTLLLLLVITVGLSVPGTYFGSAIAYYNPYTMPTKTNTAVRPEPENSRGLKTYLIPLAGTIPFVSVYIELVFIMNSLWQDDVFSMFGFMALVFFILTLICAELSIVITYVTLSAEHHRWWWQSFCAPGSSGLYVLLYSAYYVFTQPGLHGMHLIGLVVYFGYMSLISVGFGLITGFVGAASSFAFVHKIYSSVRLE